jgi:deazaflavin-dependent oxidoreductase (nitroreductase family)
MVVAALWRRSAVGLQVERALGPAHWHDQLPFYAREPSAQVEHVGSRGARGILMAGRNCYNTTTMATTLEGEYEPSAAQWVRDQVEAFERSNGRQANTLRDTGLPIIVVTMRGNKSGKVRKIALMRVEHDGAYALVGSKGGAPAHPNWVHNLRAHPDEVLLQDGADRFPVHLRELRGEERARWWERAVAAYPPYAEYQRKTSRRIPVFLAAHET